MIHFFRKIRQELLTKNRFQKYLLYAFGEIVLVMVGILLALQFSNLNQKAENKKKEKWYLNNIAGDILHQKEIFKDMILFYKESITIQKSMIKGYSLNYNFSEIDSLNDKLNYLTVSYNFPKIDNTYRELISSGQFNLISDKYISVDIINYYLLCEANKNDIVNEHNNIYYKDIYPVINEYSQVTLEKEADVDEGYLHKIDPNLTLFIKNKLKEPVSQLKMINAIKTKLLLQQNFLLLVKENIMVADSLVKKIDNYLDLNTDN